LSAPSTLEQAADNLLETVLERGAPDNVSIILTQAV
jgi:serine/threonine protein phosphatase PrpC